MPAKDLFHHVVKKALEKDGWLITDQQFIIRSGGVEIYINTWGIKNYCCSEK